MAVDQSMEGGVGLVYNSSRETVDEEIVLHVSCLRQLTDEERVELLADYYELLVRLAQISGSAGD